MSVPSTPPDNFELVLGHPATPESMRRLADDALAARTRNGTNGTGQVLGVTVTGVDDGPG